MMELTESVAGYENEPGAMKEKFSINSKKVNTIST
jgi:hypothetical protein